MPFSESHWNPLNLIFMALLIVSSWSVHAHHFKGLPHYNYFENYPQVPEEEFIGQIGDYEMSLVVYDFQGIDRVNVPDPETVRLFLVVFQLRENRIYNGKLTLEVLDGDQSVTSETFDRAELENVYSIHRNLPVTGDYSLRVILHDEDNLQSIIPFQLSSQKIHLGRWVAIFLFILFMITAVGARKKRLMTDRRENRKRSELRPSEARIT